MNAEIIISIVSLIVTIVSLLVGYYQSVRKLIEKEALDAINRAEELDKIGAEKLKAAVDSVYESLPAPARTFISKALIETVIQSAFDKVEEYAQKQISKK